MGTSAFSLRLAITLASGVALTACSQSAFDVDFRSRSTLNTTDAAQAALATRPRPDNRGVISYPNYQVAVANRGDTVADVAGRVGLSAGELARFNGLPQNVPLRGGEIIALPQRVAEPSPATGAIATGPIQPAGTVDVTAIAGSAIQRADGSPPPGAARLGQTGEEPVRHRVAAGETAFSIARLYNVPVQSLAEWNGLGQDLDVRVGQYLLIPVKADAPVEVAVVTAPPVASPGQGSPTPVPPSATRPLPKATPAAKPAAPAPAPEAPELAETQTAASDTSRLRAPVSAPIARPYKKGETEGVGFAATAGADVSAAGDGRVATIQNDADQGPIVVLRHEGNLLTVYAGVDNVLVKKGDTVKRGQKIASVRAGSPPLLHFEVREGFDSADPALYLN